MASSHDTVHQQNNVEIIRVTDGRIKSKMKNQFALKIFTKFYREA